MKVIFLDVDGVLNCQSFVLSNLKEIDQSKINLLKKLIEETEARVVITSSWKNIKADREKLKEALNDSKIEILGYTKKLFLEDGHVALRGTEIKEYLRENKNINSFVILDDEIFKDYDEFLLEHLVKTSFYENGLEEKHIEQAKKILTKK